MPQDAWGAMLADALHPQGVYRRELPCTPVSPACLQAPAGDPPGAAEGGKAPLGHRPQPNPQTRTPSRYPASADAGVSVARTPPSPAVPREPGAPHSMKRLTPRPAALPPNPMGVSFLGHARATH